MNRLTKYSEEQKARRSEMLKKKWQDPIYRARMVEKQKCIGYRTYGDGIYYSTFKRKGA